MLVVFISANRPNLLSLFFFFFHIFMLNVLINITTTAAASHPLNKPADQTESRPIKADLETGKRAKPRTDKNHV